MWDILSKYLESRGKLRRLGLVDSNYLANLLEVCQDLLHLLSFVRDCKGLELNKIKVAACKVPLYI